MGLAMSHPSSRGTRDDRWISSGPEGVPVAFADVDPNGALTRANGAFGELVGLTTAELSGQPYWNLLHPDERTEEAESFRQLRRAEPACAASVQRRLVRHDGSTRWVELRRAFVLDESGSPHSAALVLIDVTGHKQAEADAEAARRRAEAASREKDEFIAALSHDLRTPLNAMLGWTSLLKGGLLPPDQQARAIETIERNVRTLARVLSDVQDLSRIVAGTITLEARPTSLAAVVERVIDEMRTTIREKRLVLELAHSAADTTVLGEPSRLQHVVWNLLANAVKFTPAEGRIDVSLTSDGRSVTLTVRDTGVGISADLLPVIFQRFRPASGSDTRRRTGLGLGLTIAKHLVELHGGTIDARSDGEGRGATFVAVLPLAGAPIVEGAAP